MLEKVKKIVKKGLEIIHNVVEEITKFTKKNNKLAAAMLLILSIAVIFLI